MIKPHILRKKLNTSLLLFVSSIQLSNAQAILVNFNATNNSAHDFTDVSAAEGNYEIGSINSKQISLEVTDDFTHLGNFGATDTSHAPHWFKARTSISTRDNERTVNIGNNNENRTGAFTLSGFKESDLVKIEILGVRNEAQVDSIANFTVNGLASSSGADSRNYETSTHPAGSMPPTWGDAMIWTLTGLESYDIRMERVSGAPTISAMSVRIVTEAASEDVLHPPKSSSQTFEMPNVLLIVADDFGYGSINANGAPKSLVRTPHLDALADRGMRFTNANAPASVCTPTRYAIMSGRYAWRGPFPFGVGALRPASIQAEEPSLPKWIQSLGYRTAAIGKWHLGYGNRGSDTPPEILEDGVFSPGPNDIGFDYHFGIPGNLDDRWRIWIENDAIYGLRSKRFSPYAKSFYGRQYDGIDAPQRSREETMEEVTKRSIQWIRDGSRRKNRQPFFLYFTPPAAHHPIVPSEYSRGTSNCGAYGDFIHDLDRSVGQLMEALAYEGILDNTLIIFTSDNGGDIPSDPARPERQALKAGLAANGTTRGDKHSIYEGGFRVPLIVKWPNQVPENAVSDRMVNLVDLYATLAEAFEISLNEGEAPDSSSFLPTLLGKEQEPRVPMVSRNAAGTLSIRDGQWKYIEGGFPESLPTEHPMRQHYKDQAVSALYDLKVDPTEQNNVLTDNPERVSQMQEILDNYRQQNKSIQR